MDTNLLKILVKMSKFCIYGIIVLHSIFTFAFAVDSKAQNKSINEIKIHLDLSSPVKLNKVLKTVEELTNFSFSHLDKEVKAASYHVNLTSQDLVLGDLLTNISGQTDLSFRRVNDYIFIRKKERGVDAVVEVIEDAISVSGQVVDENGSPLPGASVVVKGTTNGTTTDVEGNYQLSCEKEDILIFSFVGYSSKEVPVMGRSVIDLKLTPDLEQLEEVVVIGYGAVKEKDLTGSVVSLDRKDMTTGSSVTSAAQMLQGRAAGVEVSRGDSRPGGELSVVIRGYNSISNSNEPLYVVDGFPLSAGVSINPADIESIDILKDASASAIYGSRGSSGVVLITTKKGKRGEVKVNYTGYAGVQKINNRVGFLNWEEYAANRNALYADDINDGNPWFDADDLAIDNNTDWLEEGTRDAGIQSHTISATGGDEKTRFSLSANSFSQEGILLNTKFSRKSIRLNVDREFGEKATIGMNIYTAGINSLGANNRPGFRSNSDMYRLLRAEPGRAAYNLDGSLGTTIFSREEGGPPWVNPIGRLTVPSRDYEEFRTYANLWADYEIIKGLTAKFSLGFDNTAGTQSTYEPAIYSAVGALPYAAISETKNKNYIIEGTVNYTPELSNGHTLNLLAGSSDQKFEYRGFNLSGEGFPTDKTLYNNMSSATNQNVGSSKGENRIISFFGRANYSFRDKYLVTATLRSDGASQMGANNKWGSFPSASVAWRISEEGALSSSDLIDNLKLRVAYGVTGNNNFSAYTALARVSPTSGEKQYTFDGTTALSGLGPDGQYAPNPDLKWETTNMLNIGIDFGLWAGRIYGSLELYDTKTVDMIIDKNISSASTGYNLIRANVGEMSNKGVELSLNSNIIDGGFKWVVSGNISRNRNKIVKLDGEAPIIINVARRPISGYSEEAFRQMIAGGQMGDFYGYTYAGVIQPGESYSPQPLSSEGEAKYVDVNGDGEINADDRSTIGNATPDFTWGLNNRFSYKGFSLNVFFQGVQGNELLNLRGVMIDEFRSEKAAERYSSINPGGTRPGPGYFDGRNGYGSYVNSEFIEDASYIRLKNVSLSYTFNTNSIPWLGNVELYVQGENLLTLTDYTGFDPEVSFNYSGVSTSSGRGVDDNGFPNYKTYTVGLSIGF